MFYYTKNVKINIIDKMSGIKKMIVITDCMECGSCSYTCPAGRPLLDYIRLGKSTVIKLIRQRNIK